MHIFKNMRKRYKILISAVIICIFVAFIYLFMTPDGALRLAVFLHGYPKKAMVMEYVGTIDENYNDGISNFAIVDPPIRQDGTFEENWTVTQHWIFYTADCTDLYY